MAWTIARLKGIAGSRKVPAQLKAWAQKRLRGHRKAARSHVSRSSTRRAAPRRRAHSAPQRKAGRHMGNMGKMERVLWTAVGSALSGTAGGLLKGITGVNLPANVASAGVGLLLDSQGKGKIKAIGQGMMVKAAGDFVEENLLPSVLGKVGIGNASAGGASGPIMYG